MVDRLPGFVSGVLLDAVLGDPPNAAHPVVLIGRAAALARRCAPTNDASRRKYGVAIATAIPVTAAVAAGLIERRWPAWLGG
ncbi:MAG: cobalamin biosynthesis protein, partial [Chloroflexi bacterium]|nr:cobalamin biosynthesis protein [Chloroflexota bacterium]